MEIACKSGNLAEVNRLLALGVDPSANDNTAIRWASLYGYLDVVNRLLLDPRVDPSANDNIAIRWASLYGHLDVVNRLLLDPRVDPSTADNYVVQMASEYGHLDVVNGLLEDLRVDPSADNNYAIRSASECGHLNVVNRLLEDPRVLDFALKSKWMPNDNQEEFVRSAEEAIKRRAIAKRSSAILFYQSTYENSRYELFLDTFDLARFTEEEITNFVRRDDYFAVKRAISLRLPVYNDMRKYILDEDTHVITEFIRVNSRK
jgi:hypothetical protein